MFPSRTTAASLVPSLDEVMPTSFWCSHRRLSPVGAGVGRVQMFPPRITAASLVPSLEEVMLTKNGCPPRSDLCPVPLRVGEVQMPSNSATAASLVPSAEEVIQNQSWGSHRSVLVSSIPELLRSRYNLHQQQRVWCHRWRR